METPDKSLLAEASDITYELDIVRELSMDFLADARGAIYQAEIESLAADFRNDGYAIDTSYRFGPGTVSLVLTAPDPESLHALSAAAEELGYELPEPDERLGHTPEELDSLRTEQSRSVVDEANLVVEHSLDVHAIRQVSGTIVDLMRGHQISPASHRNLQSFVNSLMRGDYRRVEHEQRARNTQPELRYEQWATTAASELVKEECFGLTLHKAEEVLLEKLAPHDDPEDIDCYLIGYPECLAISSYEGPEPATRELLWALYNAAWDTDGLPAAEIFCGAEPDAEPFVIGLYGSRDRELAFYAHPDLRDLSCATKEDLQDLHARLARTTSKYRHPKDEL